ncbi:hypothetical protein [Croceicoccus naphthovorans]|uniref:Uncharacterized protein n=1 Tax=Croceicoccus naphthovorans TaxID=1348774 RepID=A0A0G3XDF1_9SPHN|nr:hypothetical protein [Croceicoccus naphthovorans]AKM09212.1 hypothetical protein AB433_03285 [Croceicoccus naphthovorans]MBB3990404.1 hypothetical protein [Croceicoccus naphthovorans]
MAGTSIGPDTGGLLAKKGAARPAMRRQSQIQQTGFGGNGGGGALSGWLTGAEDDCGWNDMGEGAKPNYGTRSAIGLTAMTNSPESLYVNASPDDADWDEADSYDDDAGDWNAPAAWTAPVTPAPAANPVGAMQERLQAATAAPAEAYAEEPLELEAADEIPVGLFGSIRAAWARFVSLIVGRGPVTVLHLDPALREQLRNAAYRQGVDDAIVAERAIEQYLGALASKGANSATSSSWS